MNDGQTEDSRLVTIYRTFPALMLKLRAQVGQSHGNQNRSLLVSSATRNITGGVPTATSEYCKLQIHSNRVSYFNISD